MHNNLKPLNIKQARDALNYLNPDVPRKDWIQGGMAMKAAGLSFDDFHEWSKNASNYKNKQDCLSVWDSFKSDGGITQASLFHMARQNGWSPKQPDQKFNKDNKIHEARNSAPSNRDTGTGTSAPNIWGKCQPALPTHEYILRKQGDHEGVRHYPETESPLLINGIDVRGCLVIPCLEDKKIQTLQFIPSKEDGSKLNLSGASFNDGYFVVGKINETTKFIYLVEGIGQAWAINKARQAPAVVCFGAGRIKRIARILAKKHINARLIIAPDRGQEDEAIKIATELSCLWVELPQDMKNNEDVNDYALMHGYEKLAHLLTQTKTPELRYKLHSGADLVNIPPMDWLVKGVIPTEGLTALYGASGSGKSFLVLDMAFAIASGEARWFGLKVTRAPVTYVCLEGESGIGKRLHAWNLHYNLPLPSNLKFVTQPFDLLGSDISDLAKAVIVSGGTGGLIIIDTLNRAAPGADENSCVDMGNIIAAAKELQNLTGGVVLLVHHTGKDQTRGLRGHSSLFAALDGAIEVSQVNQGRQWSVAKSKDDSTGCSYPFKLEIVRIGVDDQCDEITSCVVAFDTTKNTLPKSISLGRNQKIALGVIDKLLAHSLHSNIEGTPPSTACIACEDAVTAVAAQLLADPRHRKSRARDAINGLIEKKYLGFKGEWIWRA
jgi:putative DNA primase/helicase